MSLSSDKHDVDMTDLGDEDIVFLETSDRLIFTVSAKAANQSDVIKDMLEDGNSTSAEDPLPLPNVSSEVLTKVLSFIRHHLLHDPPKGERFDDMESTPEAAQEAREAELRAPLEPWDAEFFRMNYHEFCEIILAAQFLQIEQLLQTACKAFALKLKGKSIEEMRAFLEADNDFTPEEEAQVKAENAWYPEAVQNEV